MLSALSHDLTSNSILAKTSFFTPEVSMSIDSLMVYLDPAPKEPVNIGRLRLRLCSTRKSVFDHTVSLSTKSSTQAPQNGSSTPHFCIVGEPVDVEMGCPNVPLQSMLSPCRRG